MALKAPPAAPTPTTPAYAEHLTSKPVTANVSVEKKAAGNTWGGSTTDSEEVIPGLFTSSGMLVHVEGSRTINLGNYESAKITVGLTVPCNPADMNDAYEFGIKWCSDRIEQETNSAKGL